MALALVLTAGWMAWSAMALMSGAPLP